MKILALAIPLLVTGWRAMGRAPEKSDLEKDGLKGKVKTMAIRGYKTGDAKSNFAKSRLVHTTISRYNEKGYLLETESTAGIDTVDYEVVRFKAARLTYRYDNLNNLTGGCSYKADGSLEDSTVYQVDSRGNKVNWYVYKSNGTIAASYVSEYNDHGDLLEANEYEYGKLKSRHTYKYNARYKVTEENEYGSNGHLKYTEVFKYDSKGQLTETTDYNENGSFETKYVYKYDAKGNVVEEDKYNEETSAVHARILTKYDDKGNAIAITQYASTGKLMYEGKMDSKGNHTVDITYNADGSMAEKITQAYKYDEHGNMIAEDRYMKDGTPDMKNTYTYEYDKAGNWIKKTTLEDGTPARITERDITYY